MDEGYQTNINLIEAQLKEAFMDRVCKAEASQVGKRMQRCICQQNMTICNKGKGLGLQ